VDESTRERPMRVEDNRARAFPHFSSTACIFLFPSFCTMHDEKHRTTIYSAGRNIKGECCIRRRSVAMAYLRGTLSSRVDCLDTVCFDLCAVELKKRHATIYQHWDIVKRVEFIESFCARLYVYE